MIQDSKPDFTGRKEGALELSLHTFRLRRLSHGFVLCDQIRQVLPLFLEFGSAGIVY